MQRNKITLKKVNGVQLELLQQLIKWKSRLLNNHLSDYGNDRSENGYKELVMSVGISLWYSINTKVTKQYAPKTTTLKLSLHEARFIYEAIIEFMCIERFDATLEILKNTIHQQLPTYYEYIPLDNVRQVHEITQQQPQVLQQSNSTS